MALFFADGFDHYTTISQMGWVNDTNASIQASQGRFGTAAMRVTQDGRVDWIMPSALVTGVIGFSFRTSQLPSGTGVVFQLFDGSTEHFRLELSNAGFLRATRAGTLLGSAGTIQLAAGTTYHLQLKVTIDDSAGVAVVKVNDVTDINLSSQDTRNGGNASFDRIALRCSGFVGGTQNFFDDLVLISTSGGSATDFIGDVRVESLFPNANGNSSQLVGSDGNSTDNYLLVDETAPNDDTDYVESSTVGDKDTYNYTALTPTTGTVYGVQPLMWAKKTDAGVRSIVSVVRVSATEQDSSAFTLNSTYGYFRDMRETKPGGGAFTISDVNAMEVGVKINA